MGLNKSPRLAQHASAPEPSLLSVIIPALNEEENIRTSVGSALQGRSGEQQVEVVVADGSSSDQTAAVAKRAGAQVITASRGRGTQMNAGWRASHGQTLLFLHADSQLPMDYAALLHGALYSQPVRHGRQPALWGCFETIQIDSPGWQMHLLHAAVSLRTRILHQPYGDQAIFVRANTFSALGGYKEVPLMEDVDLVRRLRRLGPPAIIRQPIVTSARRWQRLGFVRTTLLNQLILVAWRLGVKEERLSAWYRSAGSKQSKRM
ncbi:hypothetical protein WJX72_000876 [[Myrmecia] bisecta]|uniref:Glycosyltransferase 2-like domain-containing protein n=1 Tax=[Myrmecia] bisecta TaxID=41462 RepID=A0AAW1PS95_9CHLO